MSANILLDGLFAVLLYVSYTDIATHRIANSWVLVIAGLFIPFALAAHMPLPAFGMHIAAGFVTLMAGFVLFSIGLRFGGGDVKLFAALSMWCGFGILIQFFVVMCFVGGVLALLVLGLRWVGIPEWLAAHGWHVPALGTGEEKFYVPYAPAMAFGFISVTYLRLRV